jgi:hypothetical protein
MGAAESQEEKDERIKAESVFDPRYISWDHNGNLRYGNQTFLIWFPLNFPLIGLVHPVKRSEQLKEVLKRDYVDDEVGD